ncbi:MAG: AAA family ATPase, partial [Microthrixaceae bacterium]
MNAEGSAADVIEGLWVGVVGQGETVRGLRHAVGEPVHAYLLVGPEGSGKRAAATAFAAELLTADLDGPEADRAAALAASGNHPDLHVVQRTGPSISAGTAREIVKDASRSPTEGRRQVFVLDEFHLVADAAPILLKAIEEPEPATVFVVLAEEVTDPLVTIASRCVRFDL